MPRAVQIRTAAHRDGSLRATRRHWRDKWRPREIICRYVSSFWSHSSRVGEEENIPHCLIGKAGREAGNQPTCETSCMVRSWLQIVIQWERQGLEGMLGA